MRFGSALPLAAAALSVLAIGSVPAPVIAQDEDTRLRVFWWGNPDRDERTHNLVDAYEGAKEGVEIDAEAMAWSDYWPKVATQVAGGNAPDVLQMDYRYLFEYARRGALEPLDELLTLEDFGGEVLDSGKVDDKLYAISLGLNSTALFYNKAIFEEHGIAEPTPDWTWQEFADLAVQLSEATPDGVYGAGDAGQNEQVLEVWLRQRGKALYTEEGELAFEAADIEEFFAFWTDLRNQGAIPPADVTSLSLSGNLAEDQMILGNAVMSWNNSNQLVGLQALADYEVGMINFPQAEGGQPGQYLKPAMFFSVAAQSENPQAAAEFVEFAVTSPEAAQILSVERGVPGSAAMRELLTAELDREGRKMVDYISQLSQNASPLPPPPPTGAGEIDTMLERVYLQVAFDQLSPAEAAEEFVREAEEILERNK